jgi:hypothetical protein
VPLTRQCDLRFGNAFLFDPQAAFWHYVGPRSRQSILDSRGISRQAKSKRNEIDQQGILVYDGQPAGKTQLAAALPMDSPNPLRTDKSVAHDRTLPGLTVSPVVPIPRLARLQYETPRTTKSPTPGNAAQQPRKGWRRRVPLTMSYERLWSFSRRRDVSRASLTSQLTLGTKSCSSLGSFIIALCQSGSSILT